MPKSIFQQNSKFARLSSFWFMVLSQKYNTSIIIFILNGLIYLSCMTLLYFFLNLLLFF